MKILRKKGVRHELSFPMDAAFPFTPSPASFMRSFRSYWIKNGKDKRDIIGIPLNQVYQVFLGDNQSAKQMSEELLKIFIPRNISLLIGIAGAQISHDWSGYDDFKKNRFLQSVSIISRTFP